MLVEKYRPKSVTEMVGNEDARAEVLRLVRSWGQGSKHILIVGPPGVGKTTLAKALARDLGYELIEMNASDERTKSKIEAIIKPLLSNTNIYAKNVLLFIDEVDGIHGSYDRGGLRALLELLKAATIPVILAANDDTGEEMKELKRLCSTVRFKRIPPRILMLYLEHVLESEGVEMSIGDRIRIVNESAGDLRTLLNKAQALLSSVGSYTPTSYSIPIEHAMNRFFSSSSMSEALEALSRSEGFYSSPEFYRSSEDKRLDKLHALYASIVNSNKGIDSIADMLNTLSYVDVLIAVMNRGRRWNMLRYIDGIIASSIFHSSRGIVYNQYDTPYVLSSKIFTYGNAIREVAASIARELHESTHKITSYYMPYMIMILKNRRDVLEYAMGNGIISKEFYEMIKV